MSEMKLICFLFGNVSRKNSYMLYWSASNLQKIHPCRLQPKSDGIVWSYFKVNFWGILFWRYRKKHSYLKPLCRHVKQLFIPRSWISWILMQILFTFNRLGSPNMGLFEAQGVSDQTKKPKWFNRTNHRIGPGNSSTNARANSQSLTAFSSVLNSVRSFKAITYRDTGIYIF